MKTAHLHLLPTNRTAPRILFKLHRNNRPHARAGGSESRRREPPTRTTNGRGWAQGSSRTLVAAPEMSAPRRPALVVLLLAVAAAATARAADADDFFSPLSPLLAPVMGPICKAVACGKGNCTAAPGLPGYRCDCEPGWTQMHVGDALRFLPCVVPNCTIDRACSNDTSAPSPAPSPKNFSLSPCELAYCGSGGTCKNGTGLSYHCMCKEGFSNLLNMTTMPCFHDCSFGADCASIGIHPSSNSSNSPGSPVSSAGSSNSGNAPSPGSVSLQILLPLLILASLAMGQAT